KTKAKLANRDRYQRMVGKLIYLSHTRPDIAYGVGVVSRFMHQPQGYPPKESIRIMSDNKAAIQISENPVQHDRTKHVEVDRHFIKEKLEAGIIKLPFFKSEDQLADILTKAVGMVILHKCLNKLNFGDPTIQLEGEC
nr:putative ribonuclease H-like domain-containing protein [Tanacetum cinerariifolium]